MELRRRLLMMGVDGMKPWKTITISEYYTTNSTDYLANMLGIPENNTERSVYVVTFIGNSAPTYGVNLVTYVFNPDNTYSNCNWRENWSNFSTSKARTLNISAGTVVNIYRIPIN